MAPRHLALVGALATLTLAACGSDDDASSDTTAAAAAITTAAAATTTAAGSDTTAMGAMPMVQVDAIDYGFENLPAEVNVGTMIGLTNTSTAEAHELVAIRLPEDEVRPVADLLALPEAELSALLGAGPPATVIIAPPGEEGIPVVGDGTLTEPGRYLVACFIPIGADPAEYLAAAQASGDEPPVVAGGAPHFTAGMAAELVVVEA